MAERSSSTPPTAIPTSRKGSRRIQTRGYSTITSSASGQQSKSRMHQSRKFNMMLSLTSQAARKFPSCNSWLLLSLSLPGQFGPVVLAGLVDHLPRLRAIIPGAEIVSLFQISPQTIDPADHQFEVLFDKDRSTTGLNIDRSRVRARRSAARNAPGGLACDLHCEPATPLHKDFFLHPERRLLRGYLSRFDYLAVLDELHEAEGRTSGHFGSEPGPIRLPGRHPNLGTRRFTIASRFPSGDQAGVPATGFGVDNSRSCPVTRSTITSLPGILGIGPAGASPRTKAILSPCGDQTG